MDFPDIYASSKILDCIIIGAGIEGSATAYRCAKQGYKTLLLEQFALPHSRGSSHGPSRIIRYAHDEAYYAEMMQEVYDSWKILEQETNTTLFTQTGMLMVERTGNKGIKRRLTMLKVLKKPYLILSPKELQKQYPDATFQNDAESYIDSLAGVLKADKCLKCFQDQYKAYGGILQEEEKVLQILPGTVVTVVTNKGQYRAKSVAITAGPWSTKVISPLCLDLPLKVWRLNICFCKEKSPGTYSSWPIFVDATSSGFVYGFPSTDYLGFMKIGYHLRWKEVDPDNRDHGMYSESQSDIENIKQYISKHLPGLEPEPSIVENCMYTCTPTENIIIDRHPTYSNIVFACGMSGQGFKLAPVIGKLLCEMAMGKPTSYDLTPFTLETIKFQANSKL